MKHLKLMRKQLNKQLAAWDTVKKLQEPKEGWIKLMRQALGMTTYQLAKRLNLNQSRIIKLEAAARDQTIKLNTLSRVAEAMDCQLVFALVPKTSLQMIIEKQAYKLAKKKIAYISHSMHLEAQDLDLNDKQEDVEELAQQLINGPGNKLWSDE